MMQKFMLIPLLCLLAALTASVQAKPSDSLLLSEKGATDYVIVTGGEAIPAEKTAARQLQKYLQLVTTATFPIKTADKVQADAPQILVGPGKRAQALLPDVSWNKLENGGIIIKTVGDQLILAGGRPRGTLYAVFQFLENAVGCRWWTPTESMIPHRPTLKIPSKDVVYLPPFTYRALLSRIVRENPKFATILRINGTRQNQPKKWGGHYTLIGRVHSMVRMLPPKKYFDKHPEWYTDPHNGDLPCTAESQMPSPHNTQLCLTNPEAIDALTQAALRRIKRNPDAGYIDISQGDNSHFCKGPRCSQLAKAQGSQSAPVIRAVNIIAKRINKKYPGFKVETLAYQYTIKPPKTLKPANNVVIRIAPINADFGHPMDSKWNKKFHHKILAWSKISPELFIWQYATNFFYTMLPHPNWASMENNLKFYANHDVTSVFLQNDAYTGGVGNFVQLRNWVYAHLLWNPGLNQQKLITKFLNGYYGEAGPYLHRYLRLVEHAFLSQHRRLSTFNSDFTFFTLEVTNKAIKLFQKALNAVQDNSTLTARVQQTKLTLDAVILHQWKALHRQAKKTDQPFLGPDNLDKAVKVFKTTAHQFGVHDWKPTVPFDKGLAEMVERLQSSTVALPDFAKKYPRSAVIDIQPELIHIAQGGAAGRIVHDPEASGQTAVTTAAKGIWALQAHLKMLPVGRWHVYVYARIDIKPGSEPPYYGIDAGIYDLTAHKGVTHCPIRGFKVAGKKYHRIDLGTYNLRPGMYIWFMPVSQPSVKRIFIDRIILIRANVNHET